MPTAFSALSDFDKEDTYGSLMRGIVYSSDVIKLKYKPIQPRRYAPASK